MRSTVSILLRLFAVVFLLAPESATAITHATAIKMPVVRFYPECGDDRSTTNCGLGNQGTAAANRSGGWVFTQGTLEITDDGKVSLRLDDVSPRDPTACPGGLSGGCRCEGGGLCGTGAGDCNGQGACRAASGTQFEVEIWGQNFRKNNILASSPCQGESCIAREYLGDCHGVVTLTIGNGGDLNESSANGAFDCDGYLAADLGEFRDVEIRINPLYGDTEVIAVPGF